MTKLATTSPPPALSKLPTPSPRPRPPLLHRGPPLQTPSVPAQHRTPPPRPPPVPGYHSQWPLSPRAAAPLRLPRRNLGPTSLPTSAPLQFDPTSGPLASIFAQIGDLADLGVPTGTLSKDDLSWCRWCEYCSLTCPPTSPWRTNRAAHSSTDLAAFLAEKRLLCGFFIWVYGIIKPRSKANPAPKPESAYAMVCGVRRMHRRAGIDMVPVTADDQI